MTNAVTVEIDGIAPPTTHPTLLAGLAALWDAASRQAIWGPSFNATQEVLSPQWAPTIAAALERNGRWQAPLVISAGIGERTMRISPAEAR